MKTTGIICEYNPFHTGHKKQLSTIRSLQGADSGIVCLMSGNFVQRGMPAIVDKQHRAKAAIVSGADLVLELPVTVSLSSAEGFASGGVEILSPFCDDLCFGTETADAQQLLATAQALLSDAFPEALRTELDKGLSFPAARQAALEATGHSGAALIQPNDILAVEYCKAILVQHSPMKPLPIHRCGSYHATTADLQDPSATAVRKLMLESGAWLDFVPAEARNCFEGATLHSLEAGERAILGQLRRMDDDAFEALPYGSEGLWRKLMHAARRETTIDAILTAVKSKRYTMTRLNRLLMCAFLGISQNDLATPAAYVRVLAFNDRGREILRIARKTGNFYNLGEKVDAPYQALENRCSDLYGLFAHGTPEAPGAESARRILYHT